MSTPIQIFLGYIVKVEVKKYMPNPKPKTNHLPKKCSELGKLSDRCVSTRIPEKYMSLLDAMGIDRARWLRQVIVGALEKLPPTP
jgi:hypothetical protein